MTDDLTPAERIASAALDFYAAMPQHLRDECHALAELSPDDVGVRVHYIDDNDRYDVVWVGRWLGSIPGVWVRGATS